MDKSKEPAAQSSDSCGAEDKYKNLAYYLAKHVVEQETAAYRKYFRESWEAFFAHEEKETNT